MGFVPSGCALRAANLQSRLRLRYRALQVNHHLGERHLTLGHQCGLGLD